MIDAYRDLLVEILETRKLTIRLVGDRSRDADLAEIKEWEDRLDELDRQRADAIW